MSPIRKDQYVIIIGAMKSGTSSFFDYLGSHPDICPSVPKETEFFSEHQAHKRVAQRYEAFWPNFDPSVHSWALEASTGYTKWPRETDVARKMHEYGLSPKLLYVVREPIERIESHVNYIRLVSNQAISYDDDYPVDLCRYSRQLEPFVDHFGRESISLIDFAELTADPSAVCNRVFSWLGLPAYDVDDATISNETKAIEVSKLKRYLTNHRSLRRLARSMPDGLKRSVEGALVRAAPHRREMEFLSEDRKREIRDVLGGDMQRLHQHFGFDTSRWGFEAQPNERA